MTRAKYVFYSQEGILSWYVYSQSHHNYNLECPLLNKFVFDNTDWNASDQLTKPVLRDLKNTQESFC